MAKGRSPKRETKKQKKSSDRKVVVFAPAIPAAGVEVIGKSKKAKVDA